MKRVAALAVAVSVAACVAPKSPAEAAPPFKLLISFACPYPVHRGLKSVDADGKAAFVIFEGLEGPPQAKSDRQKKKLTAADVNELAQIVVASNFKTFPERAESFPPKRDQTDTCSHTLEITTDGVVKSVSYQDGDVPGYLADFLKKIDLVIERGSWEPDVYPWEKR